MTYNVHRCVGVDRRLDVGRVAAVIAQQKPDIVALQELDVGRRRTGGVDQAHEIAQRLDMACHFHAALTVEEERYGDAILTSLPETLVKAGALPGLDPRLKLEPRGALWVEVAIDGQPLQIINTHLGLVPREQQLQATALAGGDWLGRARGAGPTILLGDFNATRASVVYRTLTRRMVDARRLAVHHGLSSTFPSRFPMLRIDHVFIGGQMRTLSVGAPYNPLTRVASDHLPLVVDFQP